MRIVIRGIVQGVGFRPAVYRAALSVGAKGTVRNAGASVVIETDKPKELTTAILDNLPPLANITSMEQSESEVRDWDGFSIVGSTSEERGIGIPADSAICGNCLEEMMGKGRRSNYPFTTCTDCGARYTLMEDAPYDRKNTSMEPFEMCADCAREYNDPDDRRFHHQTVCCPRCGPTYRFVDADGKTQTEKPVEALAHVIRGGGIGVVKGWGGMHICSSLKSVIRMRAFTKRPEKPFAVMVRDMEAARKYGSLTRAEEDALRSPARPIVLVEKNDLGILEHISPGLDNVGLFLPYAGVHHMLFNLTGEDALIMTSANEPGVPMAIDDSAALEIWADGYLLHNQPIINRLDDSVIRFHSKERCFIRKSRGFVPGWIPSHFTKGKPVVAFGAQENLTSSVFLDGRIHTTQHIGDGNSYGVVDYQESATRSLINMLGCKPETVVADLHPRYSNKKLAKSFASEIDAEYLEVQHHWAHAASLMAEHKIDEAVVLCMDGTGYGTDGNAWGGEVLVSTFDSFERAAHLQGIPLIGGEAAVRDIRRLRFAIDQINGVESNAVDHDEMEDMKKMVSGSIQSTSVGRFMDALSYSLGICDYRTYDGEPAMKLERALMHGMKLQGFEAEVKNGVVMTAPLFMNWPKAPITNIALSVVDAAITALTMEACDAAEDAGIKYIGLSGGSTYNTMVREIVGKVAKSRGFDIIAHGAIPNGDGGISVGQAAIAAGRGR